MRAARTALRALALAAALAGCGDSGGGSPGLLLNQPSAMAVFRGVTSKDARVRPYLAIANAGANDLAILDARDDSVVPPPTPVPLRTLVFPVPGRPTLLASASLGDADDDPLDLEDDRPDVLVVVSAGDSALQLIRTWAPDGAVDKRIDVGGDVLALVAVPSEPGTARIAAALSGERMAVVTFRRSPADDSILVDGATGPTSGDVVVAPTGALGFQPVALAATPGTPARIWAASPDPLPTVGGSFGVAGMDLTGAVVQVLDAGAPTRLVAAARLRERGADPAADPESWATVNRVYAVRDESACGEGRPVACGLVALDADGAGLAPDFAGTTTRAPIAVPGAARALAVSGGPARPPSTSPGDAIYQAPFLRMFPATDAARRTSAVAGVASTDGAIYFVDLGRWELPVEADGTTPFRAVDPAASAVAPRAVVTFDRSPWSAEAGVRFLVPYASGVVLDATPTLQGGNVGALR